LNNFINYANEFKRHASEKRHAQNPVEVEGFLYMTGVIVRMIVETKSTLVEELLFSVLPISNDPSTPAKPRLCSSPPATRSSLPPLTSSPNPYSPARATLRGIRLPHPVLGNASSVHLPAS
jgi:hypothetical protein